MLGGAKLAAILWGGPWSTWAAPFHFARKVKTAKRKEKSELDADAFGVLQGELQLLGQRVDRALPLPGTVGFEP